MPGLLPRTDTHINRMEVSAYKIPTDVPESDGTYRWNPTTPVVVEVGTPAGQGLGYTYADLATAILIKETDEDLHRVHVVRKAIPRGTRLYVDANGAYSVKQAQWFAGVFAASGVQWFEEPVSSDNLAGLRTIREHAPAPLEVAAGEYGYDLVYFQRMLDAESVDVLQADGSRCGMTGLLQVALVRRALHPSFITLCAVAPSSSGLCTTAASAHGILLRSCQN